MKRNDNIDELVEIANDIIYIERQVKSMNVLSRWYNRKVERRLFKQLYGQYYHLLPECQHHIINEAYEQTLQFNKKIIKYILK